MNRLTSVQVNADTHRQLRKLSIDYQFKLGRQISMGAVIQAALNIAGKYPELFDTEVKRSE